MNGRTQMSATGHRRHRDTHVSQVGQRCAALALANHEHNQCLKWTGRAGGTVVRGAAGAEKRVAAGHGVRFGEGCPLHNGSGVWGGAQNFFFKVLCKNMHFGAFQILFMSNTMPVKICYMIAFIG